ncbi:hypothetical protein PHMEG_0006923 [Phytophthora megakarya]|uniref:Uncharacterized protein n=1 Tax=Phytophthora megakarya TaxID=4795 RepID=A0A225WPK0_9STRA|nr:hypothetical protein PHMEG_0006923 [Phytophthora megakarya]
MCHDSLSKSRHTPADDKAILAGRAKEKGRKVELLCPSWIPATSVEASFLRMNWNLVTNEVKCFHHAREVYVGDSEECDSYM